jgi:hypothetical protein
MRHRLCFFHRSPELPCAIRPPSAVDAISTHRVIRVRSRFASHVSHSSPTPDHDVGNDTHGPRGPRVDMRPPPLSPLPRSPTLRLSDSLPPFLSHFPSLSLSHASRGRHRLGPRGAPRGGAGLKVSVCTITSGPPAILKCAWAWDQTEKGGTPIEKHTVTSRGAGKGGLASRPMERERSPFLRNLGLPARGSPSRKIFDLLGPGG